MPTLPLLLAFLLAFGAAALLARAGRRARDKYDAERWDTWVLRVGYVAFLAWLGFLMCLCSNLGMSKDVAAVVGGVAGVLACLVFRGQIDRLFTVRRRDPPAA